MPRDRKGYIFGIGSKVRATDGVEFRVCGFMATKKGTKDLPKFKAYLDSTDCKCDCLYRWTDIENTDPAGDQYAKLHDPADTDTCPNDAVQHDHVGTEFDQIPNVGDELKKWGSTEPNKIVWGGND